MLAYGYGMRQVQAVGVAEAEAGFEERWVAGGKSNPIGYTTKSLPEWSADGNGTEVVRRSEAFGHG